jgi:SAM-dependent methyltransferase
MVGQQRSRAISYKPLFYPESAFGGFTDIDGTIRFYTRVNSLVDSHSVVLDVGCGIGVYERDPVPLRRQLRTFKGRCGRVVGIDVDEAARVNPALDEFRRIDQQRWPLDDSGIDVCVADHVLEHLDDPEGFFSECQRVIRPGGCLCIRTPNLISYIGLLSRLVPNGWHGSLLRRVQESRQESDVFPTRYRCNTTRRIASLLGRYGFSHCVYQHEPEPSYLSFSRLGYGLGVLHQRFAPRPLRTVIFAFGKRREDDD